MMNCAMIDEELPCKQLRANARGQALRFVRFQVENRRVVEIKPLATYHSEAGEVVIRYAASKLCNEPRRCECQVRDDTVLDYVR
jgi:hypothetical protein